MSCVLKRRKKRKEKLMERETPRQQQQHRDHHCHSETSELKNKNVLQSREREASHITDRTPDLSKMMQNFILKLFVILQLSAGRLGVLKESNQQLKDKTDTSRKIRFWTSAHQLLNLSAETSRRCDCSFGRTTCIDLWCERRPGNFILQKSGDSVYGQRGLKLWFEGNI